MEIIELEQIGEEGYLLHDGKKKVMEILMGKNEQDKGFIFWICF